MCVVSREQRYFCCVSLSFFYIHLFFIYSFINLGLTGPARLSALLHHHGDRICGHPKTTRLLGRPLPPCYPKNLSLMSVILHCMIVIHFLFVHSWPSVLWCSLSNLGFTLRRLLNCTSSLCTFSKPEIESTNHVGGACPVLYLNFMATRREVFAVAFRTIETSCGMSRWWHQR